MAIQIRRGASSDFNGNNLVPGEFAVTTDTGKLYIKYSNSDYKEIVTDPSSFVPSTRQINGKALGSDITLTAADVGAIQSNPVVGFTPVLGYYTNGVFSGIAATYSEQKGLYVVQNKTVTFRIRIIANVTTYENVYKTIFAISGLEAVKPSWKFPITIQTFQTPATNWVSINGTVISNPIYSGCIDVDGLVNFQVQSGTEVCFPKSLTNQELTIQISGTYLINY